MHFSLNITVHWIVSVQVVKFNLKCFVPKAKCDQDLLKRGTVYKKNIYIKTNVACLNYIYLTSNISVNI